METVSTDQTSLILTTIQVSYGLPSLFLLITCFFYFGCSNKIFSNSFYRLVQIDLATFWCRWYLVFGVLCFLYSFAPSLLTTGVTSKVHILNGTLTEVIYPARFPSLLNNIAVFSVIYFVLILASGMTTAVFVRKKFKDVRVSNRGVAWKLTKIALTYCFVYTGILSWSIATALNATYHFLPDFIVAHNTQLLLFSSDLMTLSLPYILIIYDTNELPLTAFFEQIKYPMLPDGYVETADDA
ncbi:unnamed protein product [Caenorhabditis sp. 36 PRJEB53466]|nr:unnamed protein product [Caenorhabditis sp. 36 PRJEB53466]